jgi:F-type H+-transporting ATPase subunit b
MLLFINLSFIILAAESGSIIDVAPGVLIWTIITFIILVIILKKFTWKPILTALEQRANAIKESLEEAEKAKDEAKKILDANQVNLSKAEEESKQIINQSRAFAEKLKEQILLESKDQAKKLLEEATAEIERKKASAFDELKNQVAEIAVKAAEKILKEELDKTREKELVDKYINEIGKN